MARDKLRATGRRAGACAWSPPTRSRCPSRTRTFACVTSAFLLRNLADLAQGLRRDEARDPAGRPRGGARDHPGRRCPGSRRSSASTSTTSCPRIGRLVAGDREAYTYLPQSVDRFLAPGRAGHAHGRGGPARREGPAPRARHGDDSHRRGVTRAGRARSPSGERVPATRRPRSRTLRGPWRSGQPTRATGLTHLGAGVLVVTRRTTRICVGAVRFELAW